MSRLEVTNDLSTLEIITVQHISLMDDRVIRLEQALARLQKASPLSKWEISRAEVDGLDEYTFVITSLDSRTWTENHRNVGSVDYEQSNVLTGWWKRSEITPVRDLRIALEYIYGGPTASPSLGLQSAGFKIL